MCCPGCCQWLCDVIQLCRYSFNDEPSEFVSPSEWSLEDLQPEQPRTEQKTVEEHNWQTYYFETKPLEGLDDA